MKNSFCLVGKQLKLLSLPLIEKEVTVKVVAAGINPIDYEIAKYEYGNTLFKRSVNGINTNYNHYKINRFNENDDENDDDADDDHLVLGRECAGIVTNVSGKVWNFKEGDEVVCVVDPREEGCISDYVSVNEENVILKPKNLSFRQAAALPYAGLTALNSLPTSICNTFAQLVNHRKYNNQPLNKNWHYLINGGSGAVGLSLVQLLTNIYGCKKVDVTCSEKSKHLFQSQAEEEKIKYLVNDVFDYKNFEVIPHKYHVIIDTYGGIENEQRFAYCLKKGGHLISLRSPLIRTIDEFGLLSGAPRGLAQMTSRMRDLFFEDQRNIRLSYAFYGNSQEGLKLLSHWASQGKLTPNLDETRKFTLQNAEEAFDYYHSRQSIGKIVIDI